MLNKDALGIVEYIEEINKELKLDHLLNMENYVYNLTKQMIINGDINNKTNYIVKLTEILLHHSYTFRLILSNNDERKLYIYYYIQKLFNYYEYLFSDDVARFDKFVEIISNSPKDSEIKKFNLALDVDDIQKALHLLNESVRKYYETYSNKTLITEYSNSDIIKLDFAEANLAHVLGIKVDKIVKEQSYVDLLNLTSEDVDTILNPSNNIDKYNEVKRKILFKLIDLSSGNLLELESDRLKKMVNYRFDYYDYRSVRSSLEHYSKIYARCKAFIDFKPFEQVTMALNFPVGYKLIKRSTREDSKHVVLLTKNDISQKYGYSTLLTNISPNGDRRYFESLLIQSPNEINEVAPYADSAISMRVSLAEQSESGGEIVGAFKEFTHEEQIKLVESVQRDIENLDLENIIDYLNNLNNGYSYYKKW